MNLILIWISYYNKTRKIKLLKNIMQQEKKIRYFFLYMLYAPPAIFLTPSFNYNWGPDPTTHLLYCTYQNVDSCMNF